jgi:hypothetical protein
MARFASSPPGTFRACLALSLVTSEYSAVAVLREAEAGDEHLVPPLEGGVLGGLHGPSDVDPADDG